MATELYKNAYMTTYLDEGRITLQWNQEEPNDAHATETAKAVTAAMDAQLAQNPGIRVSVLVDLLVAKKTFPRATAAYTAWLLGHRHSIKGGAFVTKSMLLRASVSATLIVPGLTMKGFSDLDDAKAFLAKIEK
jgi:hypothetical protein